MELTEVGQFENILSVFMSVVNVYVCASGFAKPASVAQWAEAQCALTGTVCRRGGVQSPGQPVDFVFGFQGRML